MIQSESLDQRRPKFIRDVVGSTHVTSRLSQQMKNGTVPNRVFLFGPTGAGKTTVAQILARHFFCRNRIGIGDPCGECNRCKTGLEQLTDYEEWTAARLEENWSWWQRNGQSVLRRDYAAFFLDEAQDLSKQHQKSLYRDLEGATSLVIFATTHKNAIRDALVKRFGTNTYEMRRPTADEATQHMESLCKTMNIAFEPDQLNRVAKQYGCDLRVCVDFVHSAAQQAPDKALTKSFVDNVFGVTEEAIPDSSDEWGMLKL